MREELQEVRALRSSRGEEGEEELSSKRLQQQEVARRARELAALAGCAVPADSLASWQPAAGSSSASP